MSTSISNAWVFDGEVKEIFALREKVMEAYRLDVLALLNEHSGKKVKNLLYSPLPHVQADNVRIEHGEKELGELDESDLFRCLKAVIATGLNHDLNFQASMMVYLHRDVFYVRFFGLNGYFENSQKLIRKWEKKGKLIDFHYQDSSDGPEDVPKKEWNRRIRIWDRIYKDRRCSQAGFACQLDDCLLKDICFEFNSEDD
jgi:hypothetical protein